MTHRLSNRVKENSRVSSSDGGRRGAEDEFKEMNELQREREREREGCII